MRLYFQKQFVLNLYYTGKSCEGLHAANPSKAHKFRRFPFIAKIMVVIVQNVNILMLLLQEICKKKRKRKEIFTPVSEHASITH